MAIKFVVCLQKQDLDDFSGALISLTAGLKPGVFKTPGRHARWLASPTISRDFPL